MNQFRLMLIFLLFVGVSFGQPTVEKLPDDLSEKTISLNPEFIVYGKDLAEKVEKLPLLIFLHGGGGTGNNIRKVGRGPMRFLKTIERVGERCICVVPQAAKSPRDHGEKGGWVPADLDLLLSHLKKTLPIDKNRVYLTGSSMGGYGTFVWAAHSPDHFAALAPMVGGLGSRGPKDITPDLEEWGKNLAKVPMKAYYGALDQVVPADRGEMILKAIKKAGGKKVELTILAEEGHGAARVPYGDPEFVKWMFAQRIIE